MDSNYHIHSFNDTVVPATCKECGYTLHKCECGYEHKDNYTPLAEHSFELVEEFASTCTKSGKKRYRCAVCGEEKEELFSVGHSWREWSIKQHPTCTEKGVQMRICSRCGDVEESEIEATGHELISPKPSETQKGYTDYFCKNCGQTVAVPSASQKLKSFFTSHKKAVIAVSVSFVMAVVFLLAGIKYAAPFYNYCRAELLIKQGEDTEAFFHLKKCGSFLDSKEKLKDFKFVYDKYIVSYDYGNDNLFIVFEEVPEYDEDGNKIMAVSYDENGNVTGKTEYQYDEDGNNIMAVSYDENGNVTGKTEYQYDKKGNMIRLVNYKDGRVIIDNKYEYDKNGNMTYWGDYDLDGNVNEERKYEYEYDKYGNIKIQKVYYGDTKYRYEYEYDKNGIKTLKTCYNENGKIESKYEFNEYEQIVQQIEYNENGEFMHRIEYEYINPRIICNSENE